jgi:hypothetical protein
MNMRKLFAIVTAALLAVTPAFAELPFTGYTARGPIAGTSTTADDNVALYVQYVGSASTKPTIQVSAGGDIQFEVAGSVDTTVACPEGDDDGVIDVSDSACDTMIEVVNAINQGGSNWRAVLVAALGTDSSNDAFASLSETDVNVRIGAPIYYDTNFAGSAPTVTVLVAPVYAPADGSFFFLGPGGGLNKNPFARGVSFLSGVSTLQDSSGTIAATVIRGVFREYRGNPTSGYDLYEVIRTVWSQVGAADDTQGTLDFSNFPLVSAEGEAFIARIGSSTTITSANLNAVGVFAQKSQ